MACGGCPVALLCNTAPCTHPAGAGCCPAVLHCHAASGSGGACIHPSPPVSMQNMGSCLSFSAAAAASGVPNAFARPAAALAGRYATASATAASACSECASLVFMHCCISGICWQMPEWLRVPMHARSPGPDSQEAGMRGCSLPSRRQSDARQGALRPGAPPVAGRGAPGRQACRQSSS